MRDPKNVALPRAEAPHARVCAHVVRLRTERRFQFIDITELVAERVRRAGIGWGTVLAQTSQTTAAIVVTENDPARLRDLKDLLERLAPAGDPPARSGSPPGGSPTGAALARALLLGASATLGVLDGRAQVGTSQGVFLVELDGPRERTLVLVVSGLEAVGEAPGGPPPHGNAGSDRAPRPAVAPHPTPDGRCRAGPAPAFGFGARSSGRAARRRG